MKRAFWIGIVVAGSINLASIAKEPASSRAQVYRDPMGRFQFIVPQGYTPATRSNGEVWLGSQECGVVVAASKYPPRSVSLGEGGNKFRPSSNPPKRMIDGIEFSFYDFRNDGADGSFSSEVGYASESPVECLRIGLVTNNSCKDLDKLTAVFHTVTESLKVKARKR